MGTFLIHPVHRKYIRLLREYVEKNYSLPLTEDDLEGFKQLISSTKQKGKRHRGLYKLTLQAINRPICETEKAGIKGCIGFNEIDMIEKHLAKAERRGLFDTIKGAFIWFCINKKRLCSSQP